VRNAFCMSAMMGWPVQVYNIRKGRKKSGLMAQHLESLRIVAKSCNAKVENDHFGSEVVTMWPGGLFPLETLAADPRTAGSVSLIIQAALIPSFVTGSELDLKGGTVVSFSPPINYLSEVLFPILRERFNMEVSMEVLRHGYFPKGGGHVKVTTGGDGVKWPLKAIDWTGERGNVVNLVVTILARDRRIADQLNQDVKKELEEFRNASINVDTRGVQEAGSFISVCAHTDAGNRFFASEIVDDKTPSREAVRKVVGELREELKHGGVVDVHTQDQLVLPMMLAQGTSRLAVGALSDHTKTGLWVAEQFGAKATHHVDKESRHIIEVTGLGFVLSNMMINPPKAQEQFLNDISMLEQKRWATVRVEQDMAQIRGSMDTVKVAVPEFQQMLNFYNQK